MDHRKRKQEYQSSSLTFSTGPGELHNNTAETVNTNPVQARERRTRVEAQEAKSSNGMTPKYLIGSKVMNASMNVRDFNTEDDAPYEAPGP